MKVQYILPMTDAEVQILHIAKGHKNHHEHLGYGGGNPKETSWFLGPFRTASAVWNGVSKPSRKSGKMNCTSFNGGFRKASFPMRPHYIFMPWLKASRHSVPWRFPSATIPSRFTISSKTCATKTTLLIFIAAKALKCKSFKACFSARVAARCRFLFRTFLGS